MEINKPNVSHYPELDYQRNLFTETLHGSCINTSMMRIRMRHYNPIATKPRILSIEDDKQIAEHIDRLLPTE